MSIHKLSERMGISVDEIFMKWSETARKIAPDKETADEVVQETAIKALEGKYDAAHVTEWHAYFWSLVMRNTMRSLFRSEKSKRPHVVLFEDAGVSKDSVPDTNPDGGDAIIAEEWNAKLRELLTEEKEAMTSDEAVLWNSYYEHGKSLVEIEKESRLLRTLTISARTGENEENNVSGALKQRLKRLRDRMRKNIHKKLGNDAVHFPEFIEPTEPRLKLR